MSEEKARETKLIQARQQGFEPRCNCLVDNPRPGDLAKPDGEVTRRAFAKLAPATTEYRRKNSEASDNQRRGGQADPSGSAG